MEGHNNGSHFLQLLRTEVERLERLAEFAENELLTGENIPEESCGKLRAAAGQARLLATKKLGQFEGLCQQNIKQKKGEALLVTEDDLAGFWDMVMIQILKVYQNFDELQQLKQIGWKAPSPRPAKLNKERTERNRPETRRKLMEGSAIQKKPMKANKEKENEKTEPVLVA